MALGGRKEIPVEIIFDQEGFQLIKTQVNTLLGEVSSAIEELTKAREGLASERKALAREINRLERAKRRP